MFWQNPSFFLQQNKEALLLLIAKSLKRKEYVRIRYCYESTIPNYSIDDFRSYFRISRHTVTVIKSVLSVHDGIQKFSTHGGRLPVELRKQILLTLWVLGNPECLPSVAAIFDVCKSTVYQVYRRVCKAVVYLFLTDECIKSPTGAKGQEVTGVFERKKSILRFADTAAI